MRIVVDLSDVLFYLRHHDTPSGIQRVQLGLAQTLIEASPPLEHDLIFVTSSGDGTHYLELAETAILSLVERLSEPRVSHAALKQIIATAERDAPDYAPGADDAFLLLGAFWVMENVFAQIADLKRAGVFIAILVHDIIPITHPEFCDKALTDSFNLFFNSVVPTADLVMTVSDHTKNSVSKFFQKLNISVPVVTLREAHRTWVPGQYDALSSVAAPLGLPAKYVCYVSTIEVRKNHLYLFHIWKRLLAELGEATPTLVLVGRLGWRVRDLMEQLESTDFLDGHIRILNGLSDVELALLYRNCLFTVFPSFVEGWGLPVGESLVFGRPCVASSTSSVPEVGGRFVDYVDPSSVPDGYDKIKRLITDDAYRQERTELIESRFRQRSWDDVAGDLVALLEEFVVPERPRRETTPPLLDPGYHPFGHRRAMSWYVRSGFAANVLRTCDANWYGVEDFGRWMRGRHASVTFRVPYGSGERLRVVVEIETPSWYASTVDITCNTVRRSGLILSPGTRVPVEFRTASEDGAVCLEFDVLDEIEMSTNDPRALTIGIRSVSFSADGDAAARLHILEWLEDMHVPG